MRYLSFAEIESIRKVDLGAHAHLGDYRDELVLGCLTGLRFSDFSNLASLTSQMHTTDAEESYSITVLPAGKR